MAEYLSPGVYVEEYDNSPRAMEGVGTSTAGFVGLAERGASKGAPVLITGVAEFGRKYGGYLSEYTFGDYRYLAGAVEQFFLNGGTRCYVARVLPSDAAAAEGSLGNLHLRAANEGSWGNHVEVTVSPVEQKKMQLLEKIGERRYRAKSTDGFEAGSIVKAGETYNKIESLFDKEVMFEEEFKEDMTDDSLIPEKVVYLAEMEIRVRCQGETEIYSEVNMNGNSGSYVGNVLSVSEIVVAEITPGEGIMSPAELLIGAPEGSVVLSGGCDGTKEQITAETFIGIDNGAGQRTGIQAFLENTDTSILAVPGITIPEVVVSLVSHCENARSRFAVIDMPKDYSAKEELLTYRGLIDSTYAAMYHPWIQYFDRSGKKASYFPPSGAVMGVYARTDNNRGVHKAPANETVNCTGLNIHFTKREQDIFNPAGVNLIRSIPGQGIRIWGARTASSNASFKYVNIRRLFIYVEESIKANTSWVVFEPNDSTLWSRVQISITSFLETAWRNGMFAGDTAETSFFVEIGTSTMTQDDIQNGRLICNIGIAPSRPAEFVIFRVTQHTAAQG